MEWCNFWILNWSNGNVNNNNVTNNNRVRAFWEFRRTDRPDNTKKRSMMTKEQLYEDLMQAYMACRKNKRNKRSALAYEMNWLQNLERLAEALYDRSYEIGTSIAFVVTRPKLREVFAASFEDRIVHHYIALRLEPLFEKDFIEDTYNCRKGKGTLYGVRRVHEMIREATENYTVKECYVAKFDMQGFFMSIHKPTLLGKLRLFVDRHYTGADKDLLLWLVEKVVMHCPEKNCVRQSPEKMWEAIPADKSLFTVGDDYGLPIGNITSQLFANFYLSDFDHMMKRRFGYYGRYVDDFVVVCMDKQEMLTYVAVMQQALGKLHVRLHPRKMYLQHYSKGLAFTGAAMRMDRLYAGRRVVHRFAERMRDFDAVKDKAEQAERYVATVNSYLGMLQHFRSYALRRKLLRRMDRGWWPYVYVCGHHDRIACRRRYKEGSEMKRTLMKWYNQ